MAQRKLRVWSHLAYLALVVADWKTEPESAYRVGQVSPHLPPSRISLRSSTALPWRPRSLPLARSLLAPLCL